MNQKLILDVFNKFFPNKNIMAGIKQGQDMIKGVDDSFDGVRGFIQKRGITNDQIEKVAELIRTNPASKAICRVAGTNPIYICNDIKKLKSDGNNSNPLLAPKMEKPKILAKRQRL